MRIMDAWNALREFFAKNAALACPPQFSQVSCFNGRR